LIVVSPGFPEHELDTTCLISQQNLIKAFHKKYPDLEIQILTLYYPFYEGNYYWNKIPVRSFNAWKKSKPAKIYTWFRVWNELRKLTRSGNVWGLLSFWSTDAGLLADQFARMFHIKHYCWICGQDARKNNRYARFMRKNGSSLVAMSDFLAEEYFKSHSIMPAHIIPNGIDPGMFSASNHKRTIDILGIGSLIPLKRFDIFIRIIKIIKLIQPEIRAVICGKGPEYGKLMRLIESSGLNGTIHLMGELPHEQVLELMQTSRLLLHPSDYEGFSTCCLEAVHAGANVISFCKPMKKDIPNWLIARDEKDMIEKAIQILAYQNNREESFTPYLIEAAADSFKALFEASS
jgi:glycosyltransferase involved in cell wall biosynthesis